LATFNCAIVTPSKSVLDEEVTQVEFPQWDGSRGILAGAAPFVAKLGAGRLRIESPSGSTRVFMLAGGFAEMHDNALVLVADEVIAKEDLDLAAAEARLVEAIAAVTEEGRTDPFERERLEMARSRATVEVAMAKE
jgi:F-type H+-transporting ATPase subunit epsilon